ncbi:MAG: Rpn family recombination-promoting nuclease/putative transposase, partial [Acidobacteriota bacterium]
VGLFYQRLLKEKPLAAGERLPPVLPIVFYNGESEWWAPLDVSQLIASVPPSFERYVPSMQTCLIDEKRWPLADLERQRGNVVAGMARVEQSESLDQLVRIVQQFNTWLDQPEQSMLRRDVQAWLTKVVFPAKLPGVSIPELNSLDEFQTFVEDNMQTWPEQWKAEGLEEGLRLGRREGVERGRREGVELGRREGVEKGLEKGRLDGEAAVLRRQLKLKFGEVDGAIEARIAEASSEQLLAWAERLLTAKTVGAVFAD